MIANVMQGINCSLIAHGSSGAGKTYSMDGQGSNVGLLLNVVEDLFSTIAA